MTSPSDTNRMSSPNGELGIRSTYKDYFLQYASYVIRDRAIPHAADGLKPVQRRILHALWENEDGRYNKVANLVGHCMKYHPHGDASIYAALVTMAQKELLIDTQGNWGNPLTGDSAAAARYIEARLTPFARDVVFAPHLTECQLSYDGRNQEPVLLPVRFPLLLATGAEGIAVGMTTRVLPHNFLELLEAQKAWLRNEEFTLYPDFPGGGLADVTQYKDGAQGSRVRVRARVEIGAGKTLIIRELPYGTTTEYLIDSILSANEKGKIKLAHIEDNTAEQVEIVVTFQRGVDMEQARNALYAFTNCEISLASNPMVIRQKRPEDCTIPQLLIASTKKTRALLKQDLEYRQERLIRKWHRLRLVQIFVEHRVYLRIEDCRTWDAVLFEIDRGLDPHKNQLRREVTEDDLVYLTEVKIKRISAWDAEKAKAELERIDRELADIRRDLRSLTDYTIRYIDRLIQTYGEGRQRKTELTSFDTVKAQTVAARTEKLYVDRKGGFIGTDPKIGEEIGPCSILHDVMVVLKDGGLLVTRVDTKKYVGENIMYLQLFEHNDRETTFNLTYEDPRTGRGLIKRFQVGGITRDRRYELGKAKSGSRVLFFQPSSARFCYVRLRKKPRIKTDLYVDFEEYAVKGRGAAGVVLTKHKISSVREISERVYRERVSLEAESSRKPTDSIGL